MEEIKIRDKRNKEWFIVDNAYLNGYAKIFGAVGTAIYISLCRHADNDTQKCFPSQKLIAEELGISERTIRRYIDKFADWNLISIERGKDPTTGQNLNNIYLLIDKSQWKKKPEDTKSAGKPEDNNDTSRRTITTKTQRTQSPHNNTQYINNTQLTILDSKPKVCGNNGTELLNLFYKEINPNIKFNNKTIRNDAIWLVNKYGIEKLTGMILYIKEHQNEKYFPNISNPTQLRDKMAQVINHANQKKDKKTIIII
jgi:predicted transcriptional regulator